MAAEELNISPNDTRIGLATYSTRARNGILLDECSSFDELRDRVMDTPYIFGDTNMADAMSMMRTRMFEEGHGDRSGVQNFGILVTDGYSNIGSWRTIPEAFKCHDAQIHMFTIGIGLAHFDEIRNISSKPQTDNTILAEDFDALPSIAHKLVGAICEGDFHNGYP